MTAARAVRVVALTFVIWFLYLAVQTAIAFHTHIEALLP